MPEEYFAHKTVNKCSAIYYKIFESNRAQNTLKYLFRIVLNSSMHTSRSCITYHQIVITLITMILATADSRFKTQRFKIQDRKGEKLSVIRPATLNKWRLASGILRENTELFVILDRDITYLLVVFYFIKVRG
jgi:carbon starvation protein CstA